MKKNDIIKVLAKDMGDDLAGKLLDNIENQDIEKNLVDLYKKTAELWTPIIIHFTKWIKENSNGKPIKFAMRDAEVFAIIYNLMYENGDKQKLEDSKIWINRNVCGIKSEDKNQKCYKTELMKAYIEQEHLNKDFIFVDAGCWGTIIKDLYTQNKLNFHGQPLFFFSHNPFIESFLSDSGVSEEFGEILNDSLECFFPKKFCSIEKFNKENGKIVPLLVEDQLMNKFHNIFIKTIKFETELYINNEKTLPSLESCIKYFKQAQKKSLSGEFNGILPTNTPGTVNKEEFLNNWPENLNWTKYDVNFTNIIVPSLKTKICNKYSNNVSQKEPQFATKLFALNFGKAKEEKKDMPQTTKNTYFQDKLLHLNSQNHVSKLAI